MMTKGKIKNCYIILYYIKNFQIIIKYFDLITHELITLNMDSNIRNPLKRRKTSTPDPELRINPSGW